MVVLKKIMKNIIIALITILILCYIKLIKIGPIKEEKISRELNETIEIKIQRLPSEFNYYIN
jgi:hypothetical protein